MSIENDSDKQRPGIIKSLLSLPGDFRDFVIELRRLNNHLENLQTNLDEVIVLNGMLRDFREMVADKWGWRIKEDSPKK